MAYDDVVAGVQPYPQPISELPTTIASTGSNFQIRIHPSSSVNLVCIHGSYSALKVTSEPLYNHRIIF